MSSVYVVVGILPKANSDPVGLQFHIISHRLEPAYTLRLFNVPNNMPNKPTEAWYSGSRATYHQLWHAVWSRVNL